MIKKYFAMSIIAASVALAACSDDDDDDGDTDPVVTTDPGDLEPGEEPAPVTIDPVATDSPAADPDNNSSAYDIVANSPDHTVFAQAIIDADLADLLDDPDNTFTIFAPTDTAFADLGDDVPTGDDLSRVVQFHLVSGAVFEVGLAEGATTASEDEPFTLESFLTDADAELTITADDAIFVGDSFGNIATIINPDIVPTGPEATGVVQSIDTVLTPPAADVVDPGMPATDPAAPVVVDGGGATTLSNTGEFTIFLDSLNGPDGTSGAFPGTLDGMVWTFFAPTDAALAAAGLTELTAEQLQSHIFTNGALDETALSELTTITPSDNVARPVANTDGTITVDGSVVTQTAVGDAGAQIFSLDGVIGVDAEEAAQ